MSTAIAQFPMLATERLTLRAPIEADFEAHAAFMSSDRAALVGGPQDRWQSWRGFLAGFGHWALRGYGFWTIALADTDAPIGKVGFVCHDGWDEPELGWQVYGGFEGQGYAFEAAKAAQIAGPRLFNLSQVISYIAPSNDRSRKLALRLGATYERDAVLLGTPCHLYRHPAPQEAQP